MVDDVNENDSSDVVSGVGGFKLPALDPVDDLPMPNVSSGEDDESRLDDEEEIVDSSDVDLSGSSSVLPQDDAAELDEVAEAPEVVADTTEPVEDEELDELSDDAALRAIFRAKEGNGGEVPEGFDVTNDPTLADLFDLDSVLEQAIDFGASDVHISPNEYVAFTKLGEIVRQREFGRVTGAMTESIQQKILTNQLEANFVERLELDTSYVIHGGRYDQRRFRLSVGKTFGDIFFVFRVISDNIPSPEDLGVTGALRGWSTLPNGLVMMNGPTGTGKALALSTMIPTPDGPKELREIKVGSLVFDSKHNAVRVTGLSDVDESPELYRITLSDGQVILADSNHQWIVSTHSSRASVRDKRTLELKSKKARMLQIAASLDNASVDVAKARANEIHKLIASFGAHEAFPRVDSLQRVFRFMSTPYEGTQYTGKVYSVKKAFADSAARIRQRYEYAETSPLRVMTTAEMIDEGVDVASSSNFGIPVAKINLLASSDWIYVRSIERVAADDVDYEPVRCISVDSEDHSYLCADHVVTHNSTTLASLVNAALDERAQKVITIERPIEYVFTEEGKGFVTQREVGQDSREFATALDSAMRQAPDIIMIGESRNREEIDQVLRAAETGHLAMTTMHTNSAAATINRIKSLFEGNEQARVLSTLSDVSRGFANQVLVKTIDGESRFAIRELLEFTEEVQDMVAQGDIKAIRRYQMDNHITMEDGLVKAVVDGRCTVEAARAQSAYPLVFDKMLKSMG